MKVTLAIKALGNPGGGAERVLVDIANGLAGRGYKLDVVSYDPRGKDSFYALDDRVEWIQLGIGSTDRPATLFETTKRICALRSTMSEMKPDVVVGFMHSMYIPLGFALAGTGCPMIASEHSTPAHYVGRRLEHALLHLTPWLAKRITVVSDQVMAEYPAVLRKRMTVIPNPVRVRVASRADVVGTRRSRKVLLSVGRLTDSKDYATLIDAFALVGDRLPDWDLRIVGEGALRDTLEARIAETGMKGRISLPGATENICGEYAVAQLFVLPSLYESQGLALAEALCHGLPAVGFADCPGVNRLIRPGWNGVLASGPDRVSALAEALEHLMADATARENLVPSEVRLPEALAPEDVFNRWEDLLHQYCRATVKPNNQAGDGR